MFQQHVVTVYVRGHLTYYFGGKNKFFGQKVTFTFTFTREGGKGVVRIAHINLRMENLRKEICACKFAHENLRMETCACEICACEVCARKIAHVNFAHGNLRIYTCHNLKTLFMLYF